MADFSFLKNLKKPIAVAGLGITGSAIVEACDKAGVATHLWDDSIETRKKYQDLGYTVTDFTEKLDNYAFLVPTAGMKPSHPIIKKAKECNIPIKSDIDLLYESAPEATYIGITGTNGKSTTTALISHILTIVERNHAMGGNIGIAAAALPSLDKEGVYILEMSSYQLEITTHSIFDMAVFLNITPDHLAWHQTMENYIAAKEKIFRVKTSPQIAIIGVDTEDTKVVAEKIQQSSDHDLVSLLSPFKLPHGLDKIETLKGQHNQQNIAAAYAVCKKLGIKDTSFIKAVQKFPGLPHRQQIVATINGITFVNDSKATNAESTSKALDSFENIHWIVGGEYKGDDLSILKKWYPKVKHAYLIGESAPLFEKDMIGHLDYSHCQNLEKAVFSAFETADDGDVILMSTACASFDQYPNFEKRGEHFIDLIQKIEKGRAS